MPLQITGRHIEISPRQKEYIERKSARLTKLFDRVDELSFILAEEKLEHIVEANFRAGTIHVFIKTADSDPTAAIDKAIDKLESGAIKAKEKRSGNHKHAGRPKAEAALGGPEAEGPED